MMVSKLTGLLALSAIAVLVGSYPRIALAGHHQDNNTKSNSGSSSTPVHGPGASHNPIIYHPVHGPGSSHNPVVNKTGLAPGTVVRDHRNGKNCSYVVGDAASMQQYYHCEGAGGMGGHGR